MATINKFGVGESLNSLFKNVYGDKIHNLIPDGVKLYKELQFSAKERLGGQFVQPVILG